MFHRNPTTTFAALNNEDLLAIVPSVFATAPVEGVSERYSFLPTASILDGMRENGWLPVSAREQGIRLDSRRGFQKHELRFCRSVDLQKFASHTRRGVHEFFADKGGPIRPEVIVTNSHDRSSSFQIHLGFFRLACCNGLVVCDSTIDRVRLRHSAFNPEQVIQASLEMLNVVPDIEERVHQFQDRILTPTERLALATGALALRYDDPNEAPVCAEKLLQARRREDEGTDLWRTFNVVQENVVKGGVRDHSKAREARMRGERAPGKIREVKSIDENMKLNKALWHMAEVLRKGGLQA
jgi:Domain of unknown function (DUF932)